MSNEHDAGNTSPQTGSGAPAEDAMLTMDELMARYQTDDTLQDLREGDLVTGTVVQITDQCAMIDVGTKSEGMIPKAELDLIRDSIEVGSQIQVYVARIEDEDGNLIVSKRQADRERAWEDIIDKETSGEILEAEVIEAVKGGLLVDLGVYGQGFVPASHVSIRRPRNLGKYVGQTLRLQVIEVERKRKRVVLSHRKVVENERAAERDDTLKTLREGQVRRGVVRRITDFGAFVDIGGVDGLLHISEMSWNRIDDPSEMLRVGDETEVMVLKLNLEENRISLGLRQLQHDPWRELPKIHRDGQLVRARITRLLPDGVVVRLPVGVEGYVPIPAELRVVSGAPATEAEAEAPAEAPPVSDSPDAEQVAGAEAPAAEAAPEAAETEVPAAEAAPEAAEAEVPAAEAEAPAESVEREASAEAVEAAAEVDAEAPAEVTGQPEAADPFAVGSELEVRIDRIQMVERELEMSLASLQPARPEREPVERRAAPSGDRTPLARGRYSDRVRTDEDEERGDRGAQQTQRRERRREREREEEREQYSVSDQAPPPARRTLGDLMGDKLRSLFSAGEEAEEGPAEPEERAEESSEDASE